MNEPSTASHTIPTWPSTSDLFLFSTALGNSVRCPGQITGSMQIVPLKKISILKRNEYRCAAEGKKKVEVHIRNVKMRIERGERPNRRLDPSMVARGLRFSSLHLFAAFQSSKCHERRNFATKQEPNGNCGHIGIGIGKKRTGGQRRGPMCNIANWNCSLCAVAQQLLLLNFSLSVHSFCYFLRCRFLLSSLFGGALSMAATRMTVPLPCRTIAFSYNCKRRTIRSNMHVELPG